ncbi:hypothetical protein B0T10DRAFT_564076 [Thelonectria olida]|uniref:Apopolysialoglycoprotein n=1 Tax=Thelonectria olida TaxID=1576542 RepID=A0A9P9ALU4_9HYPO|nr:hypothetical protein B0T10DRAFT_564076 [Thelonectria olida]
MAPGTRRANRSGYAEHDDFEGLPVRQWRHDWVTVAPPPQQEQQKQNDIWSIELLHGMPKDSHLLPPHSQELLLAARSGRLYKRPAPAEDDEADNDALPEKTDKKEEDASTKGFSMKVWKQIPRNSEATASSHLAKRRKNTVTIASRTVEDRVQGPTVTRATVRRIDAAGNAYTEEVTLGDGQQVVGEIISTRVEPAPGPRGEAAVPPAPAIRKRPLPPKRKPKGGPGRGKKRVKFPATDAPQPVAAPAPANGAAPVPAVKQEGTSEPGIKQEVDDSTNHDSEAAGDDDDDDDDDGDEGDEGDDGDESATPADSTQLEGSQLDSDRQDHEMTDAAPMAPPTVTSAPERPDIEMGSDEIPSEPLVPPAPVSAINLAPPLSLGPLGPIPRLEGSPLKNVIMPSPTTEVPPEIRPEPQPQVPLTAESLQKVEVTDAVSLMPPTSTGPSLPVEAKPTDVNEEIQSAVAEPRSIVQAPEAAAPSAPAPTPALESVIPQADSLKDESLLPPPPEEVGNIDSTPPAAESVCMAPDGGDKPVQTQATEEAVQDIPSKPSSEHADTVMTEDSVKPEDSASVVAPVSETAEIPPVEPASEPMVEHMEVEDMMMEDTPVESFADVPIPAPAESIVESTTAVVTEPTGQEETPASPPKTGNRVASEEPNLLGALMGELDRQSGESMETEPSEPVPTAEPVPEAAPEPVAELVIETVAEPAPEVADLMDTADEPAPATTEAPVETSAEAPVVPPTEPPAEVAGESAPNPVPESAVEPAEVVKPEESSVTEEPEPVEEAQPLEEVQPSDEPRIETPQPSDAPTSEPPKPADTKSEETLVQEPPSEAPASEATPVVDAPIEAPATASPVIEESSTTVVLPVAEAPAVEAPPVESAAVEAVQAAETVAAEPPSAEAPSTKSPPAEDPEA